MGKLVHHRTKYEESDEKCKVRNRDESDIKVRRRKIKKISQPMQHNVFNVIKRPKKKLKPLKHQTGLTTILDKVSDKRENILKKNENNIHKEKKTHQRRVFRKILPEPVVGIYQNGFKGKEVHKSIIDKTNKARLQDDIVKLLHGNSTVNTKVQHVFNSPVQSLDLKITREKSFNVPIETVFKNPAKLNLVTFTHYKEFCTSMCTENFQTMKLRNVSFTSTLSNIKAKLKRMYLESEKFQQQCSNCEKNVKIKKSIISRNNLISNNNTVSDSELTNSTLLNNFVFEHHQENENFSYNDNIQLNLGITSQSNSALDKKSVEKHSVITNSRMYRNVIANDLEGSEFSLDLSKSAVDQHSESSSDFYDSVFSNRTQLSWSRIELLAKNKFETNSKTSNMLSDVENDIESLKMIDGPSEDNNRNELMTRYLRDVALARAQCNRNGGEVSMKTRMNSKNRKCIPTILKRNFKFNKNDFSPISLSDGFCRPFSNGEDNFVQKVKNPTVSNREIRIRQKRIREEPKPSNSRAFINYVGERKSTIGNCRPIRSKHNEFQQSKPIQVFKGPDFLTLNNSIDQLNVHRSNINQTDNFHLSLKQFPCNIEHNYVQRSTLPTQLLDGSFEFQRQASDLTIRNGVENLQLLLVNETKQLPKRNPCYIDNQDPQPVKYFAVGDNRNLQKIPVYIQPDGRAVVAQNILPNHSLQTATHNHENVLMSDTNWARVQNYNRQIPNFIDPAVIHAIQNPLQVFAVRGNYPIVPNAIVGNICEGV